MDCSKCGRNNDSDSNFCKHCGNNLKDPDAAATNLHYTIFDNPTQPAKLNTELGYLIIALIVLANISLWFFWGLMRVSTASDNFSFYTATWIISTIFVISEFVVMFIFTKRPGYRVTIGIIGAIVAIYNLFYLIDSLTNRY
jgi:Predicted membrane protein